MGCPLGTFGPSSHLTSRDECMSCFPGTFANITGAQSCLDCPPGKVCGTSGVASPSTCPAGHWCSLKTVIPHACLPGTFSNQLGASSALTCQTCTAGYLCGSNATISLVNCPAGSYCVAVRIFFYVNLTLSLSVLGYRSVFLTSDIVNTFFHRAPSHLCYVPLVATQAPRDSLKLVTALPVLGESIVNLPV
jgi:hypothetical protein